MKARVILGIVLLVALLGLFTVDSYLADHCAVEWAPVFFAVAGLVAVAATLEMTEILRGMGWQASRAWPILAMLLLLGSAALGRATGIAPVWHAGPVVIGPGLAALAGLTTVLLLVEVARASRTAELAHAVQRVAGALLVVGYVGGLLLFVVGIRFLREPDGLACLLLFLGVAKASDIGAYFAGRAVGRRKLTPRLSPNKTVEGCLGGLAFAVAVSLVLGAVLTGLAWWKLLVFGVAVTAAAMLGDLAESLIKRAAKTKDAGTALPGFGGVLDMLDSVLLSAPVAYLVLLAMGARH